MPLEYEKYGVGCNEEYLWTIYLPFQGAKIGFVDAQGVAVGLN